MRAITNDALDQIKANGEDIKGKCKKDHFLTISFNNNCMFRCKMCQMWKAKSRSANDVSIEEFKDTVRSLKNLDGHAYKGVTFAGGEPLAEPEILDLVHFTAQEGLFTVMSSNGYLIDSDMAQKICSSKLHSINLSLDSTKEQRHDFLRGINGSYRQVIKAVDNLAKFSNGLSIGICTVIMKPNLDDIIELIEWVEEDNRIDGIAFQAIVQPFNTISDDNWYKKEEFSLLWPDDLEKIQITIDKLIEFKKKDNSKIRNPVSQLEIFKAYFARPNNFIKRSGCNIQDKALTINQLGEVSFCYVFGAISNIKKHNIKDILLSKEADEMRMRMDNCKENCNLLVNCYYEDE